MRDKKITGISLAEFLKPRTFSQAECDEETEIAYRRGYFHGYSRAMDDAEYISKKGYTRFKEIWNYLVRFFDGPLTKWRYYYGEYDVSKRSFDLPPNLKSIDSWNQMRNLILERDKKCTDCGSIDNLEIDHILPVAKGGIAEENNLRVLCKDCHISRLPHVEHRR